MSILKALGLYDVNTAYNHCAVREFNAIPKVIVGGYYIEKEVK